MQAPCPTFKVDVYLEHELYTKYEYALHHTVVLKVNIIQ
jgi:hypothetical protein